MPYKEQEITKLYHSIGEVADMFDVNASLIRFWEKEFSIIKPKKNKKGNRLFTEKDIKNLKKIYQLVKVEGYTLDGAKQRLKSKEEIKEDDGQQKDVILRLSSIRKELLSLSDKL